MREIVSPLSGPFTTFGQTPIDIYKVGAYRPELALSFFNEYYRSGRQPVNFLEAITHAASSNATMVDSDGLLKWRPHNLLTYSEDITQGWTATNVTVNSADTFTFNTSGGYLRKSFLAPTPAKYTLKATISGSAVGDTFRLEVVDGADGSDSHYTVVTVSPSPVEYTVEADMTSGTFSGSLLLAINRTSGDQSITVGSTITITNIHVYRSDLGGMAPVPADFQTAGSETYVRTAGRPIGPELVTNGTFDTNDDTGWTRTIDNGWDFSGGAAAHTGATGGRIRQAITTVVGKHYYLVFDLDTTGDLSLANTSVAIRNSADNNNIAALLSANLTANAAKEYSLYFTATETTHYVAFYSEDGATLDNVSVKEVDVNPATARYLPRIGHHVYNGSQWVNEGLLHESEARTNLITYSNDMTAAGWSPANTTRTATTIIEDTATANHGIVFTGAGSTGYMTFSCDASNISGSRYLVLRPVGVGSGKAFAAFDIINGAVYATGGTEFVNADIIKAPNDSWRCSMAANYASAPSGYQVVISSDGTEIPSYAGDGTSGFTVTNHQYEAGSTPSSYIPTSGATSTRAAETLTIPYENLTWPEPVVIGDELVTNGTFDSDLSGWTLSNSPAWVSGRAELSRNGGIDIVRQSFATTIGAVYKVTADVTGTSAKLGIGVSALDDSILNAGALVNTSVDRLFVATTNPTWIYLITEVNGTSSWDNVSVREIKPLSVSIQMDGRMTYADEDQLLDVQFFEWAIDAPNRITSFIRGSADALRFEQSFSGTYDDVSSPSYGGYSPGVSVPFSIASRHGSTFINGAVDGVALTENTTPVALPDLSETDLELGYAFMGTIGTFRVWAEDIGDTGIEEASEPSTQATLFLSFDGSNNSYADFEWSE